MSSSVTHWSGQVSLSGPQFHHLWKEHVRLVVRIKWAYWITCKCNFSVHCSFKIKDAGRFPDNRVLRITGEMSKRLQKARPRRKGDGKMNREEDDMAATWQWTGNGVKRHPALSPLGEIVMACLLPPNLQRTEGRFQPRLRICDGDKRSWFKEINPPWDETFCIL